MQIGICFIEWTSFSLGSFDCACAFDSRSLSLFEWEKKLFSSKSNQMLAQIESDTHIKHFMKSVTIHSIPFPSMPFIHGLNVRFEIHWNAPNDTRARAYFIDI